MVTLRQKMKPHRSRLFLAFCHEQMRGALCCVCGDRSWEQLHHWGDDGGTGMKPNDFQVARVCSGCHEQFGHKERALLLAKGMSRDVARMVLHAFTRDSMLLLAAYAQQLEGKRERSGCARDALLDRLKQGNTWMKKTVEERVDWIMEWADRRAAELFDAIEG